MYITTVCCEKEEKGGKSHFHFTRRDKRCEENESDRDCERGCIERIVCYDMICYAFYISMSIKALGHKHRAFVASPLP